MIRAVLVADEKLALLQLERMLKEWPDMEVVATYIDPAQALSEIGEQRPDAIFLDIQMPGMDGLQVADRIQQADGEAEIVFVTAYDRFAIEAFELNALDYLLKPLDRRRLQDGGAAAGSLWPSKPGGAAARACRPLLRIPARGQP
jgi:two-component system LytT family response regulator